MDSLKEGIITSPWWLLLTDSGKSSGIETTNSNVNYNFFRAGYKNQHCINKKIQSTSAQRLLTNDPNGFCPMHIVSWSFKKHLTTHCGHFPTSTHILHNNFSNDMLFNGCIWKNTFLSFPILLLISLFWEFSPHLLLPSSPNEVMY